MWKVVWKLQVKYLNFEALKDIKFILANSDSFLYKESSSNENKKLRGKSPIVADPTEEVIK